MDTIFSSYFVTKEDPQRHKVHAGHDFGKMKQWYNSVNELGLNGVIFQDHMVDSFIEEYWTENIKFAFTQLGSRSVNDESYYSYYDYLSNHPEIDRVFMTDLFDVRFFRDPFELFRDNYQLYIGDEQGTIGENGWMQEKYRRMVECTDLVEPETIYSKPVLNSGIIGGKRDQVLLVIENMLCWFEELPDKLNMNMPVLNLVVRKHFDEEEIMHGFPLNSLYKEYEEEGDFYIKHK